MFLKKEIKDWLNKYKVINYRINKELTVYVEGDVYLAGKR